MRMRDLTLLFGAAALLASGCSWREAESASSGAGREPAAAVADASPSPRQGSRDPCTLVSRLEVERYVGPLAGDPYRSSSEGTPLESGSVCFYRAASGRSVAIEPTWEGGRLGMKAIRLGSGPAAQVLGDVLGEADTLGAAWDDVTWMYGTLYALQGDALISVDVTSAGGDPVLAATLANLSLSRLEHPLAYDGAGAVRRAPGPLVEPRDPCSLVTAAEAAAILGPLAGAPRSTDKGCVYPVPGSTLRTPLGAFSAPGSNEVVLEVTWTHGFKSLYEARQSTSLVKQIGDTASMVKTTCRAQNATGEIGCVDSVFRADTMASRLDRTLRASAQDRKEMAVMRGVMQSLGVATADSSLQLRHDTSGIAGPWDEAVVLAGLTFMAVKKDVLLAVNLHPGLEKAKALVAKAMSRL
jgi:hypothetical protein